MSENQNPIGLIRSGLSDAGAIWRMQIGTGSAMGLAARGQMSYNRCTVIF